MDYRIVVTKDAEDDLDRFVRYLIVGNVVYIDNIFHELQDCESKMC